MKAAPSEPLSHGPAYVGLFACLFLAVLCNAFLDIAYGSFGVEAVFWGLTFASTLFIGWRQQGQVTDSGKSWHKGVLLLMAVLFLLVFMPMWGMPRAAIYLLCGLQAAQNCISVTRRHFQFGLLVSAVLVVFAASHMRADWTLMFYLVPYTVAVVLTLVAEQVARRARQVEAASLGNGAVRGQGLAVVAASAVILGLAGLLYLATPQATWLSLSWDQGLPGGVTQGEGPPKGGGAGDGSSGSGAGEGAGGGAGPGESSPSRSNWPSVAEMRQAAARPGMPQWQRGMIQRMADLQETLDNATRSFRQSCVDWWEALKRWLQEHAKEVAAGLLGLLALAMLAAWWFLARESRPGLWLRTRLDYLLLGWAGHHGEGRQGARRLYGAAERLCGYYEERRQAAQSARSYRRQLDRRFPDLAPELRRLVWLFEQARYGARAPTAAELAALRQSYCQVFAYLARLGS